MLAALLRIDCNGGSAGRETREEAAAICRQERIALEMRRKWIDSGNKRKSAPMDLVMNQILG